MVNNSTRMLQITATALGLIESTCMMKDVKVTFATVGTTGMSERVKANTLDMYLIVVKGTFR